MRLEARFGGGESHTVELCARGAVSELLLDGRLFRVEFERIAPSRCILRIEGRVVDALVRRERDGRVSVLIGGAFYDFELSGTSAASTGQVEAQAGVRRVRAQMPGRVVRILLAEGTVAEKESAVLILEAMKMQNEVRASRPGRVTAILVVEGQSVSAGQVLFEIE